MKYAQVAGVIVLAVGAAAGGARGAVANGDFETGDTTGWTVSGSAAAKDASFGITPAQGTYQGYIETTGNFTALAPAVVVSLGVPGSAIMGLGAGTPTNGTGISQSVTVAAGDVLTYDWNFATDELDEEAIFNDFAFFTVSGSAALLASRNSSTFSMVSPPAGFDGQTGWATGSYAFPSAGTYQIGFGIFNVGDSGHNSVLLLDSVQIATPEPASGAVLGMAAGALLMRRRRRESGK